VTSYFETAAAEVADLDDAVPARRTVQGTPGLPEYAREEYFGLSFEGWIQVPTTGIYRFTIASDDGSSLTIDGRTVVDHDGYHGLTRKSGSIALDAGRHTFRLRASRAQEDGACRSAYGDPVAMKARCPRTGCFTTPAHRELDGAGSTAYSSAHDRPDELRRRVSHLRQLVVARLRACGGGVRLIRP